MKLINDSRADERGTAEMILDGFLVLGLGFFAVRCALWAAAGFPFVK